MPPAGYRSKKPMIGYGGGIDAFEGYVNTAALTATWTTTGAATTTLETTTVYPNTTGAMKIAITGSGNVSVARGVYVDSRTTLAGTADYRVRAFIKLSAAAPGATIGIDSLVGGANLVNVNSTAWQAVSGTYIADFSVRNVPFVVIANSVTAGLNIFVAMTRVERTLYTPTWLDEVTTWTEPSPGSEWVKLQSGIEDSWVIRHVPHLRGVVRWIPNESVGSYENSFEGDGWTGGANGANRVNWRGFLGFARRGQPFQFYPDRADASVMVPCYLVEPMAGEPPLDTGLRRSIPLVIRSADGTPFPDY